MGDPPPLPPPCADSDWEFWFELFSMMVKRGAEQARDNASPLHAIMHRPLRQR